MLVDCAYALAEIPQFHGLSVLNLIVLCLCTSKDSKFSKDLVYLQSESLKAEPHIENSINKNVLIQNWGLRICSSRPEHPGPSFSKTRAFWPVSSNLKWTERSGPPKNFHFSVRNLQ